MLLNKILKPTKSQVVDKWAQGENIFTREPFLRSDADLWRFEKQFALIATRYEHVMQNNNPIMNDQDCISWSRKCYYHSLCIGHKEPNMNEFRLRPNDYVEDEYYNILGLTNPNIPSLEVTEHASD
jgi:hypothetical protein